MLRDEVEEDGGKREAYLDCGATVSHGGIPGEEFFYREGTKQIHHILTGLPVVDLIPGATFLGGVGLDERSRRGRSREGQIRLGIRESCAGRVGDATPRGWRPGRCRRQRDGPRGMIIAERALMHANAHPPAATASDPNTTQPLSSSPASSSTIPSSRSSQRGSTSRRRGSSASVASSTSRRSARTNGSAGARPPSLSMSVGSQGRPASAVLDTRPAAAPPRNAGAQAEEYGVRTPDVLGKSRESKEGPGGAGGATQALCLQT